ncbi:MAG: N-acetylneuraminate synthase [Bacteroidota bacterium]
MSKTLIIAEAGVNHNGDIEVAKQLIDVAADAGVDYVKFQTFKTELIISPTAQKAAYQIENTGDAQETQFEMVKKLELDRTTHEILMNHCSQVGIKFLSTAFDLVSIDLLEELGVDFYKIPSGEITNLPYLEKIASKGKPIVLSTGMATLGEIEAALTVLYKEGIQPNQVTILHCNTEYPTPLRDVNLRAMTTIGHAFSTKMGYSDHTLGIEVPIAAVAMGATCIEKHFTLSRNMEGPDHKASLEPNELKTMVQSIRNIEVALGSSLKQPSNSEVKNRAIARKSIHLAKALEKDYQLTSDDFIMLRPGNGISPMEIKNIQGKKLNKSLPSGHMLRFTDLQ